MIKLFNWLKRIYEGWKNVILGINTEEYQKRYDICMACDKKIRLTRNHYICSICGCELKAKSRSKDEVCDLNKW